MRERGAARFLIAALTLSVCGENVSPHVNYYPERPGRGQSSPSRRSPPRRAPVRARAPYIYSVWVHTLQLRASTCVVNRKKDKFRNARGE